jgi:hypothetical protein
LRGVPPSAAIAHIGGFNVATPPQVFINGRVVNVSEHVSYATAYHNVLATPSGNNPHIHPSEPNYFWSEAGTNFGVLNDNDPFLSP